MATIHTTFGMLFHSVVIGSALYGAGCLQGYLYFRRYKGKDGWILQSLVGFILVCDTFQMAILAACLYQYVITNQGNPAILGTMFNTLIIEVFFSGAIGLMVQLFYCWRIWLLSKHNWIVVGFLVTLSMASFVLLLIYSGMALQCTTYLELTKLKNLSMSCNILAAAADISISCAMIYYLHTSKTGYKKSNSVINRLIMFTFNAGIPVSVCALLACITINVWSDTFIYMFFFLLQGRFYTNSILVTLNSRRYIRCAVSTQNSYSLNSYRIPAASHGHGLGLQQGSGAGYGIGADNEFEGGIGPGPGSAVGVEYGDHHNRDRKNLPIRIGIETDTITTSTTAHGYGREYSDSKGMGMGMGKNLDVVNVHDNVEETTDNDSDSKVQVV